MKFSRAVGTMTILASVALMHATSIDLKSHKISPELQEAFKINEYVDIIIEMKKSTEEIEGIPGETSTYVEKLQAFTQEQQKPVKKLLAQHPNLFHGTPTYFWISDTIFVPQASTELVSDIADIDNVKEIRPEQVAHIQSTPSSH